MVAQGDKGNFFLQKFSLFWSLNFRGQQNFNKTLFDSETSTSLLKHTKKISLDIFFCFKDNYIYIILKFWTIYLSNEVIYPSNALEDNNIFC